MQATINSGLVDATYHLPGPRLDICDWGPENRVDAQRIERLLENGCRYFHDGSDYSDSELIIRAIEELVAHGHDVSSCRYLIHAHTQPFSMPAPPESILSNIIGQFSMNIDACFSTSQLACASIICAIDWATKLLAMHSEETQALVVTADRVFGKAKYRVRQDGGIQSDGASALLLSNKHYRYLIKRIDFKHFPTVHEGPEIKANDELVGRYTWLHSKQLFLEHQDRMGIQLSDYGAILPINADRHYWHLIAKSLKVPDELFFTRNIGERGHACCADFAINLVDYGFECLEKGQLISACGQSNIGSHGVISLLPPEQGGSS
ncbi:hypothetical protein [Gynuella sp.]|uniref:hypothetical protein n=1 Tax=Gynuella sp. TaxID=2969146 RepID=UPI003D100E2E